uniref:Uncharacterized protein n=1 Tax=viral metagenome TaxID=1070528 RepID=A0A6H1ZDE1_9ZZZZ
MKKFWLGLVLIFLFWAGNVLGAGTVTQTDVQIYLNTRALTFTCTADSTAHTYPVTASDGNIDGYVFLVVTNPGTVGPTDNYDITLTDSDAVDVMGGELLNRDILNSEHAIPLIDAVFGSRFVKGPLTITITNNLVNSAVVVVTVFYYR